MRHDGGERRARERRTEGERHAGDRRGLASASAAGYHHFNNS